MKYNFTIPERLTLLNMFPKKGDIHTMQTVKQLISTLEWSETELSMLNLNNTGGEVKVDAETRKTIEDRDFHLEKADQNLIKSLLSEASDKRELPLHAVGLWDKFVEPPKSDRADIITMEEKE